MAITSLATNPPATISPEITPKISRAITARAYGAASKVDSVITLIASWIIILRKGAGKSYAKVATMKIKESFCFVGPKKRDSDGYDWYFIS